jgi:hypothetical protein
MHDPQWHPPDTQPREAVDAGRRERRAIVGADRVRQAARPEQRAKHPLGARRPHRGQAATDEQGATEVILHGQRIAVAVVTRLELPIEVGRPHLIGRLALHGRHARMRPAPPRPSLFAQQAMAIEQHLRVLRAGQACVGWRVRSHCSSLLAPQPYCVAPPAPVSRARRPSVGARAAARDSDPPGRPPLRPDTAPPIRSRWGASCRTAHRARSSTTGRSHSHGRTAPVRPPLSFPSRASSWCTRCRWTTVNDVPACTASGVRRQALGVRCVTHTPTPLPPRRARGRRRELARSVRRADGWHASGHRGAAAGGTRA